jgi:cyclopropane-fatty-acyl-phospholipid synthase
VDTAKRIHVALGEPEEVGVAMWDGSTLLPRDRAATLIVNGPEAFAAIVRAPGELGLARAYVRGDLDVGGDLEAALGALFSLEAGESRMRAWIGMLPVVVAKALPALGRAGPVPEIEARVQGRLHTPRRDTAAVTHHYDVSNEFYELVLGPAMTYSCAVFADPAERLVDAQRHKHELVSAKLGLEPDMRLLDIGCGWGSMLLHAARHHGVRGVGVTLSEQQATWARARIDAEGLADRIDIRRMDYRELGDETFDAISSIGMFEHVGRAGMDRYMHDLHRLLQPGGRVLHHAIARPAVLNGHRATSRFESRVRQLRIALGSPAPSRVDSAFMQRFVFPDAELHELGTVMTAMQEAALEVRHVESLREHYPLTLRHWVRNLDEQWDEACRLAGAQRARVWKLYMTSSALGFEHHDCEVHQVLAARTTSTGSAAFPLRPAFDHQPRARAPGTTIDLRTDADVAAVTPVTR